IGISEPVVARSVYRKVTEGGIATSWIKSCDCSDHGPFEHAGIPASFMWSGDEPNYHSSSDTPPNMDPNDLARTGRAVRVFVKQLNRQILEYYRRKG
ncbi:MAG TPA: M28 family peptidase, partial [Actinomycetota bacterium]|nr:M28 family peptidase [Actinomycetota bacterium]